VSAGEIEYPRGVSVADDVERLRATALEAAEAEEARPVLRAASAVVKTAFDAMAICARDGRPLVSNGAYRQLIAELGAATLGDLAHRAIAQVGEDVRAGTASALHGHAAELRVLEHRRLYVVVCRQECASADWLRASTLRGVRQDLAVALDRLREDAPTHLPPPGARFEPDVMAPARPLTTIERQIFGALIAGFRVSSIARQLHVSEATIRSHLRSIFAKHGVHSQAALFDKLLTHKHAAAGADPPATNRASP
jgi:ATP/maltotriose-dependent transcriptional regulator MalT